MHFHAKFSQLLTACPYYTCWHGELRITRSLYHTRLTINTRTHSNTYSFNVTVSLHVMRSSCSLSLFLAACLPICDLQYSTVKYTQTHKPNKGEAVSLQHYNMLKGAFVLAAEPDTDVCAAHPAAHAHPLWLLSMCCQPLLYLYVFNALHRPPLVRGQANPVAMQVNRCSAALYVWKMGQNSQWCK